MTAEQGVETSAERFALRATADSNFGFLAASRG